jgi:hypothetical protein
MMVLTLVLLGLSFKAMRSFPTKCPLTGHGVGNAVGPVDEAGRGRKQRSSSIFHRLEPFRALGVKSGYSFRELKGGSSWHTRA